jgi:hypothetical protein
MKGQYTPINMAGAGVSAGLLVASQFSAVSRRIGLSNVALENAADVESCSMSAEPMVTDSTIGLKESALETIDVVESCSVPIQPMVADSTIEIEKPTLETDDSSDSCLVPVEPITADSSVEDKESQEDKIDDSKDTDLQFTLSPAVAEYFKELKEFESDYFKSKELEASIDTCGKSQYAAESEENTFLSEETESAEQESVEPLPEDNDCSDTKPGHRAAKKRSASEKVKTDSQFDASSEDDSEFESLMEIAEENAKKGCSLAEEKQDVCETEAIHLEPASQMTDGCPKNLEYYHQNPKPKEIPAECYTCSKLVACVYGTGK